MIEGHQFEVSTFRRDLDYQGGRRPSQIELADAQQDALRRDFTVNGYVMIHPKQFVLCSNEQMSEY
jgi:tRNA nucleotidyltransferase/poly(A) polymerase